MKTLDFFGSFSFSSSTASQLGRQLWLIQRAELPAKFASITYSSLSVNRNVWPLSASPLSPASTSAWVRRLPLYSMMRSPRSIGSRAKTPLPWIWDLRAAILRGMRRFLLCEAYCRPPAGLAAMFDRYDLDNA